MNQIQVVFLFASYRKLTPQDRAKVKDMVREVYESEFGSTPGLDIRLEDGIGPGMSEDIILAIQRTNSVVNEATYRSRFAEGVRTKLWQMSSMRDLGFGGKVGWQDGLLDAAPAQKEDNSEDMNAQKDEKTPPDALDYHKRAKMYQASEPKYSFDMLALPQRTMEQIEDALNRIKFERKVFEEWGLHAIMPSPVCALSFFGPPGTGKTLAAEAIASYLKKPIIRTSYADIENKYVGEGPKNVSAVFIAAEEQDAVLLIDEADSLLSKRLVNVQEASGQAINSMRSQLLISLERFHGIVVFATNLVVNYDSAFISRLINVEFTMPDVDMRQKIWEKHLLPRESNGTELRIPLADDVDLRALAEKYELVGRDIRNAVVDACVKTCSMGKDKVDMAALCAAVENIHARNRKALNSKDFTKKTVALPSETQNILENELQKKLDAEKAVQEDGAAQQ